MLPVKIKLSNAFLGESCYIGSNAQPDIVVAHDRQDATPQAKQADQRKSQSSKVQGRLQPDHDQEKLAREQYVRGAASQGLRRETLARVDRAVDAELGLPAAAGHNTAILDGTLKDANAPAVKASE